VARFTIRRRGGTGGSSTKRLRFDTSELDNAILALHNAGAELGAETMQIGSEILVAEVQEVFEKEGAVAGNEKWEPFWWQRRGLPKPKGRRWQGTLKLLQDSGVLAGSITPFHEAFAAEAFTNVPYAGYHVSQRARQKLPMRDFTAIDFDRAQAEFVDVILAQLDANMQRSAE
jgi:phage gpG-like protein